MSGSDQVATQKRSLCFFLSVSFLFCEVFVISGSIPAARADSEASTSASSEAGLEAPGLIGRRRRGWRRYGGGANASFNQYQKQQMMQARQLQQQQNRDLQRTMQHESRLATMPDRAFVKDYGGGRRNRNPNRANWQMMQPANAATAPTPAVQPGGSTPMQTARVR